MKLWFKYLLAIGIGYLYAAFIPFFRQHIEWLYFGSDLIMHIIPWVLYPMIFFSLSTCISYLRSHGQFIRTLGWSWLWSILAHGVLVFMGGLLAWQVTPPIEILETSTPFLAPQAASDIIDALSLQRLPLWLVMACSVITGLLLSPEDEHLKAGHHVLSSFNVLFSRLSRAFSEFLSLGLVVLAGTWVHQNQDLSLFTLESVLLLISVLSAAVGILLILPLFAMLLSPQRRPYTWLAGLIAPALAAAVSGSYTLAVIPLYGQTEDNLGVSGKVSGLFIPFYAVFARAGTAMISAMVVLSMLASYQHTPVSWVQMITVCSLCIAASLFCIGMPNLEVTSIAWLVTALMGYGFPSAFSVIGPALLLQGTAAAMDVIITGMGSGFTAHKLESDVQTQLEDMV